MLLGLLEFGAFVILAGVVFSIICLTKKKNWEDEDND